MATTPVKTDPATEAWSLVLALFFGERPPRIPRIAAEFDVSPMALKMLQWLEPGVEMTMSGLAEQIYCDASNVTGIVDRLEARDLIERRDKPGDRRVKLIGLTAEGERWREQILERLYEPPEPIAGLSVSDQRALRDVLRRAVGEN